MTKLNTFEVKYQNGTTARMGVNELNSVFGKGDEVRQMLGARASNIPARTRVDGATIVYQPMYLEIEQVLYRFTFDVRRMGTLEGVFVSTKNEVASAIDRTIHFGEALGKHSQIDCELSEEHLEIVSMDQTFIKELVRIMGTSVSGYNPIERLKEHEEEMEWIDGAWV